MNRSPTKLYATLLVLIMMATTSMGQVHQLPPDADETLSQVIDDIDFEIISNDPTGKLPTINSLVMESVNTALAGKLDAYKGQLTTGLLPKVPMSQVAFEDIGIQEGFLPNRTLSSGLDLLGALGLGGILEAPHACLEASPPGGTPATTFTLDATCSTDVQDSTRDLEARWDWTGDGTYDTPWTLLTTTHTYTTSGTKTATVQIRDTDGNTATATSTIQVSAPPTACFTTSKSSGTTATAFHYNANCSTDDFTPAGSLRVRWDWTNDGTYDTSWTTTKTATHTYATAGTHTTRMQVQDGSGLTASTTRTVTVTPATHGDGGQCNNDASSSGNTDSGPAGKTSKTNTDDTVAYQCSGAGTVQTNGASASNDFASWLAGLAQGTVETPDGAVLYQRMPHAPYEPAQPGEAQYQEGHSLRLHPAAVPSSAIVDLAWLESAFGTHGSPAAYDIIHYDGRPHAHITDATLLTGAKAAFRPIVLGQSTLYTTGHKDLVELQERAMQVRFVEYPAWNTAVNARQTTNGTLTEVSEYWHGRLGIDFHAPDTHGQTIHMNRSWLAGLGIDTPRFTHEEGNIIDAEAAGSQYVVRPMHFSTIYAEDFDDASLNGWSLTGLWRMANTCASSHSGSWHLAYNKDASCTYNTGSTTVGAATFDVDLTGVSIPYLQFYHKWTTESFSSPYDVMRVQVSTNGGSSWTTLQSWDSTMSNQATWKYQSYSLSSYTGNPVKIRFYFNSGDGLYNDFLGWLVDSVQVTGTSSNTAPNACFSISPTSGTTDTSFSMNASCSSDAQTSASGLQVRWDWENDGTYDTDWTTTKSASHQYASPGTKTIRLQVKDGGGLMDTETHAVSVSQGSIPDSFAADFESGTSGWSMTGLWHRSDCRFHEGQHSLAYNTGSCAQPPNYDVGTTAGSATSPVFKIPTNAPVLRFASWYETEGGTSWDRKYVEVSSNGGSSWTTLEQIDGNARDWRLVTIPMEEYAGEDVRIRFRFDSVDGLYNRFEGWYVDDVGVMVDDEAVVYSSEWVHSTVQASSFAAHWRHDQSAEVGWPIADPSDHIRQTFQVNEDPGFGGTARLWVLGRSLNCSNDLTHVLRVNGQPYTQFSTCLWGSSSYRWVGFDMPMSLIQQGINSFEIRTLSCGGCTAQLYVATDGDSPGTYTDLVVDGQSKSGYEAYWYLYLQRPAEYETLERYVTNEYKDQNGMRQSQHSQEVFVYLDPDRLDTLYLLRREQEDGSRVYLASNIQFVKRAEYSSSTHVSGYDHWVMDPDGMLQSNQGKQSPSTGVFYTWFVTEWEALVPSGDGNGFDRQRGKYMQLVPSNPSSPSDKQGPGMNPSPVEKDTDPDDGGSVWNLELEFYVKTCEWKNSRHWFWQEKPHPHDCFRVAFHMLDLDEKSKQFVEALDLWLYVEDQITPLFNELDFSKWMKNAIKIGIQGPSISWLFSMAQSGDLASINLDERDYGFEEIGLPVTVFSMVPPVIGWKLPPDPQVPGHWLLWNGSKNWDWSVTLWDP